ncbi:metal cation transporter MSC2 [Kluyveromyces lactis]|uniref:Zinc transporter n=1 Tax=Kluyveromyces lactis (strain ATCC 8585 / CBS 2359 / DSM 70799 / NBRC 1267 / NRRL Y-1140 / WM37) TaxID=284590 RepID=Q6CJ78_KLULA|nr:uncharacterized protein KLLA0_F20746g [Kluyveromyces lactis]CAG98719.1 KLLA0F20746p [Kluyveromyces lactis]|eukprot:XP_456011.1 uncharacterized protein KLLA0_F20746g [Kluyveromyces lactis]
MVQTTDSSSNANTLLSRIPLTLLYPTLLLSNNLILTVHDDILDQSANHVPLLIQYLVLPIFASCLITLCSQVLRTFSNHALTLVISFLIIILNLFLGPVEASTVSVLLLQLVTASEYNLRKYAVLPLLSIGIDYYNNSLSFTTVLSYILILAIIFSSARSKKSLYYLDHIKVPKSALLSVSCISLVIMYLWVTLSTDNQTKITKINYSMLFVFLGCTLVLLLVCQDIKTTLDNQPFATVWQNQYSATIIGFMAMVLQYLSFNAISSSSKSDFLTAVFILISGILPSSLEYENQGYHPKEDENPDKHCQHQLNEHEHEHSHSVSTHSHTHDSKELLENEKEFLTTSKLLMSLATNKETKSIFSFLLLNSAFMFVQLLYSFRSRSLGLLSDSLHMALDCTSLFLGLLAGVLSKYPASDKYPFALGYLETIAGFTNGVLLIGIVIEIFIESFQRIFNPVTILGTTELLVVSILGLLVNVVGLCAFDHGHAHGEHESNDNMRGIFLHVLADTLGSVGVIISTLLTKIFKSQIFDPIASFFIASLILLSSLPLLKSTGSSLLLKVDDKKHALLKNVLNQIVSTPGVTGYTAPRFWPESTSGNSHGHSHGHSHTSSNSHEEENNHSHESSHSHTESPVEAKSKSNSSAKPSLVGYIHVQYIDGENSTIIKKRVERIFERANIKVWIQVEAQSSACWCRATSMKDQAIII